MALWEAVEDEAPEVAQIPVGSLVFSQFWSIPDGDPLPVFGVLTVPQGERWGGCGVHSFPS